MISKSKKKNYISDDSEDELLLNNTLNTFNKTKYNSDQDYESNDENFNDDSDSNKNCDSFKKPNLKSINSDNNNASFISNSSNKKIEYASKYKSFQEVDSSDILVPDYLIKLLANSNSSNNSSKFIQQSSNSNKMNLNTSKTLKDNTIGVKKSIESLIPKKYHIYKDFPIMNNEFSVYDKKKHCWVELIFPLPSSKSETRDQVIILKNTVSAMLEELSEQTSQDIPNLDSSKYFNFKITKLQNNLNIVKRYLKARLFNTENLKKNKFLEDKLFLSKTTNDFSNFLSQNDIYALPSIDTIHAIRKEYGIYSSAIHEIGRQISASCNERYDLLTTLLDRIDVLFEEALVFGLKDFVDFIHCKFLFYFRKRPTIYLMPYLLKKEKKKSKNLN